MSTQYEIANDGAGGILELDERSSRVSFVLSDEVADKHTSTVAVFDEDDLIEMCVKILTVASYIAEDPEGVRAKLHNAIAKDAYLGSMKY